MGPSPFSRSQSIATASAPRWSFAERLSARGSVAKLNQRIPDDNPEATWPSQAMLFAQDVARMNALRKAYERLVPVPLDIFSPAFPETRVRETSILFSDIRGFTAIAEKLGSDPDRLLSVLNEHFRVAVRA